MNQLPRTLLRASRGWTTTKPPTSVALRNSTMLVRGFASSSSSETSDASSPRPFKILGVQQIAVGSTDKAALRHLWVDLLGCGPVQSTHVLEKENVDEDILSLGSTKNNGTPVEVDLMSPIDPDKKPKVRKWKMLVIDGQKQDETKCYPQTWRERPCND